MGGRSAEVISVQKARKTGQAISGSRAPSSASRVKEMLDWSGIGRVCSWVSSKEERRAWLALAIWPSQLAV
jgi:hypothetical protein